jgi:thioredoxin:protein disulfide reductase
MHWQIRFSICALVIVTVLGGLACPILSHADWADPKPKTGAVGTNADSPGAGVNTTPLKIRSIELNPPALRPGGMSELKVKFQIAPGYRAYVDQFQVEPFPLDAAGPKDVFLSEVHVTPVSEFRDPVSKKTKLGVRGDGELVTVLQLPSDFRSGSYRIGVSLTYQACTDDFCLFPTKVPTEFQLKVDGPPGSEDALQRLLQKGWWTALLVVFLAGILTSFTPCIFPLIPITLAVIGSRDAGGSKFRGAIITLSYVLGIALTYSVLGVVAAKTGALFGSLLGHPLVVGFIAVLFVIMGLSMYGLFEIKFPDRWSAAVLGRRWQKGVFGAFFSGLAAGVVASPCVGPVLVSILAFVAKTQDVVQGFVLLFVFAFGLGQVFLVLGTFSQLLTRLPKSGPWMDNIKFIFGTTMIAMALFFVHPVAHSTFFDGLVATALISIATFFGAFERLHVGRLQAGRASNDGGAKGGGGDGGHGERRPLHPVRRTLMLGIFGVGWLFAVKTILPDHIEQRFAVGSADPGNGALADFAKPDWATYSEGLLQTAGKAGRPVILDFKAEWCLACKELEMYTFSNAAVLKAATEANVLWLSFDATKDSPELSELRRRYNIPGLPAVLLFDSKGQFRQNLSLFGFEDANKFLIRLQRLAGDV